MEYGYLRWHLIILFVIASEWLRLTKSEVNLILPEMSVISASLEFSGSTAGTDRESENV